jgi:hypothetical protein
MTLHPTTFNYLQPTEEQIRTMSILQEAAKTYAAMLDANLPDNPDKTYLMRKLREVAMWANVCVTRHSDGAPRQ